MRRTQSLVALTAIAVVGLIAAGCSSGGQSPSTGASATGPASASVQEFTTKTKSLITKLSEPQTQTPPTEGPAPVPGKEIWIVNFIDAEAGAQRIVRGLEEGAKAIGWTSVHLNSEGDPNKVHANMQQAISAKPDAIVVVASDASLIKGDLRDAEAAGIPVACNTCADLADLSSNGPFVTIDPAVSRFSDMGYAATAWSFIATNERPRYITTNDNSLSNLAARENGYKQFLSDCQAAGGDCQELASQPFLVADLNTTFSASAAGLARANPDWNVFWTSFDYAALQLMTGLNQAGLGQAGSKMVVASNGDGANLEVIAGQGMQPVTVGIGFEWGGFATIDNLNRHFAGQPPVDQHIPIRLFDASNAEQAKGGNWEGDVDFKKSYADLWSATK